jgi:hypothetical protein
MDFRKIIAPGTKLAAMPPVLNRGMRLRGNKSHEFR